MITYYLYREADKQMFPLGEVSFDKFYADDGWFLLDAMAKHNDQSINNFVVRRSDQKGNMSIEKFLDEIRKYEILISNL